MSEILPSPDPGVSSRPSLPPAGLGLSPPQLMDLRVEEVLDLSPNLRQIRLAGEALVGFDFAPGQDLMLRLPRPGGGPVNRRYTIRRADRVGGTLDLNVVLHGDGPAARWARTAAAGQVLEQVVGPRGKITLDPGAEWHVFLGDETYLPGALAMLEALPRGRVGMAALGVSGPEDEQPLESLGEVAVDWLPRGATRPGDPDRLRGWLDEWRGLPGPGHFYIAAEVRVALGLRDLLLARGVARELVSAKGYWVSGRANADRGEPDEPG